MSISTRAAQARRVLADAIRSVELDRAYASLPKLDCQRKCQESCGPIVFAGEELRRIRQAGLNPLVDDFRYSADGEVKCPLLVDGDCLVYQIRPMVCRLWGLTRSMACPFGCVPERWLSDEEAHALLDKAQEW